MTYIAVATALVLIVLDQLIKIIVDANMMVSQSIPVIQDVLHFTYVQNEGAAFGIFQGQRWILVGVTSVVILGGIYLLAAKKLKSNFLIWSVALVIAGGVGNLIDRIFRHFVIDYIEVRLINFAVFNFADCCVVIGTIMIVCYLLFSELWEKKKIKSADETSVPENRSEDIPEESIENMQFPESDKETLLSGHEHDDER